ncbi:DUF5615 family PIN-like protein [uncultured Lamprocystis sp.]|jgi:hypothetical protein|uniref:DUF5615 family PIN-like protein n=1 Tax=uncultured Lamprocystis sp. TaxID=543132 RepID=UPI0025CF1380|nr:DUF5615 family PIN-like protein [uncultured Lamprocystis sp.]
MKIKLDENLPARLVAPLQRHGHDVNTVPAERLSGKPDELASIKIPATWVRRVRSQAILA